MPTFVLIHSPLVGPLTWALVADELRRRGQEVLVPRLTDSPDASEPLWRQHVACVQAAAGLPAGEPLVIAGHSGAGWLLPAIGAALGRPVAAYLFVDAQLPLAAGEAPEPLPPEILQHFERGGRYPNWTDEQLRHEIPDAALRTQLLRELQPRGRDYFATPVPVPAGWPDAPAAYLRFSPHYAPQAERARAAGWPGRYLPGGHFQMLVEPDAVATALIELAEECRISGA
ncbi:MAG TPA: hypothetical protein VFI42_04510 [Thermomicrobiaceae bacterium]|nr:hypothetical protein [Thermomicrobiaceae bacterium]